MPWELPQPTELADRLAGAFETAFAPPVTPAGVDARSPNATLAILARTQALGAFDLYLFQQLLAAELFVDTAADPAQHGDIWGVRRIAASAAIGSVTLAGAAGTVVPSGQQLSPGEIIYATQAAATLDGTGAAIVTVRATTAGAAGSLPDGTSLLPVTPLAGLTGATVSGGGLIGADEEALEAWRSRILARIRSGPDYGQARAYERAAKSVSGVSYAAERPGWAGAGSIGVIVAMAGPRAPSSDELALVQAALDLARPVTATVVAVAATLQPVPLTIALTPDTVQTRAAVTTALQLFFAAEAAIGGTLARSRISEAISSAAGEYSHVLSIPSADIDLGATALATLGTITWAS